MEETPRSKNTLTKLRRIAELAREASDMSFTSLAHHIDKEFLREAFRRTRKDGAVGVDGQTAREYADNLDEHLQSLLDRAKSGSYRAPPVRRVNIPKGDGKRTRPIGIPTFEDKVLQRAVTMVLEAVYEQDFLECSYGFRPKRSAHQALQALWEGLTKMSGGWVIELDIRSYFDTIDKGHIRELVRRRVRDGVLTRLIGKWLSAGVMEGGNLRRPKKGTPQGGVISPLLANVYLHHVLDKWWQDDVLPRMRGEAFLIRYADDAVMAFRHRSDAERVLRVLPKRFARFGLELHPEKTRLVRFVKPPRDKNHRGGPKPGSFDFLGFTHYWGRSRKGRPLVKRKTAKDRFRRALQATGRWLRHYRHEPVSTQHEALCVKLQGHYAYYGITNNGRALDNFHMQVERLWRKWLGRRSWRARMPWERFRLLLLRYPLPRPRVIHSAAR